MTTKPLFSTSPSIAQPEQTSLGRYFRQAWSLNPMLTILLIATIAQFVISLIGLLVDPRIVVGLPNWAKNLKFSISFLLFTPTILWIYSLIDRNRKTAWWMATGIGVTLLAEMALLLTQAVRGQPMHFNVSTPFDDLLWSLMGNTINVFSVFFLVLIVIYWRQLNQDRVVQWAIRLGLVIMVLGFVQGGLMPGPTAEQLAQMEAGNHVTTIGAHTVGASDGGPGLPFLGWSTEHGDLRIGHFVGTHALQVIPLLGWWLSRRNRQGWLSEGRRIGLVWIGALAYLGVMLLVTWQALRGESIVQPGLLTLSALGGLIAVTVVSVWLVVMTGKTANDRR